MAFRGLIASDIIGITSDCGFVSLCSPIQISVGMFVYSYIKPRYDRVLDILQVDLEHVELSIVRKVNDVFEEERFFSTEKEVSGSELSTQLRELSHSWSNVTEQERETEVKSIISRRKGQEKYRQLQIELWDGKCALTGISILSLLNGSHAKAWEYSNDSERLDPFNGFLFEARIDRLFDKYLISFDDSGKMIISSALGLDVRKSLGINEDMRISRIDARHVPYLRFHREKMKKQEELFNHDQSVVLH